MKNSSLIFRLYSWVLHNDMERYKITVEEVVEGIKLMNTIYGKKQPKLQSERIYAINFENPAYRCAYVHKYAPLHAVLVYDVLRQVIVQNHIYFSKFTSCFQLCTLGGGPGSDVLGTLLALQDFFGAAPAYTTFIDFMPSWNSTVNALVRESQSGIHGHLQSCLDPRFFSWSYIGANLLEDFSPHVQEAISSANLINMIKFVSVVACLDTSTMIKRIFDLLKPGAIVFFIDSCTNNVENIFCKMAVQCKLQPIFGPINQEYYSNREIKTSRFGYSSCFETCVAIQVWIKPHSINEDDFSYDSQDSKDSLSQESEWIDISDNSFSDHSDDNSLIVDSNGNQSQKSEWIDISDNSISDHSDDNSLIIDSNGDQSQKCDWSPFNYTNEDNISDQSNDLLKLESSRVQSNESEWSEESLYFSEEISNTSSEHKVHEDELYCSEIRLLNRASDMRIHYDMINDMRFVYSSEWNCNPSLELLLSILNTNPHISMLGETMNNNRSVYLDGTNLFINVYLDSETYAQVDKSLKIDSSRKKCHARFQPYANKKVFSKINHNLNFF